MSRHKPLVQVVMSIALALPCCALAESLTSDMALPADRVQRTVIELPSVWLNAGESRYLWSVFKMTGPEGTTMNYLFAGQITCSGPAMDPSGIISERSLRQPLATRLRHGYEPFYSNGIALNR